MILEDIAIAWAFIASAAAVFAMCKIGMWDMERLKMSDMNSIRVKDLSTRAKAVLAEISGVVSQSGVSQWEVQFLNEMVNKNIGWGSPKQNSVMDSIEVKTFGEVRKAA